MSTLVRVTFNRRKRYPHPDGPVRKPGDEVLITGDLALQWSANGIVTLADANHEHAQAAAANLDAARGLLNHSVVRLREAAELVTEPSVIEAALELEERKTARAILTDRLRALTE